MFWQFRIGCGVYFFVKNCCSNIHSAKRLQSVLETQTGQISNRNEIIKGKKKKSCECQSRSPNPRRILMDKAISSTKTLLKHLNKLPKKLWRFRCKVTKKERFLNRNQKEKKKRSTPKSPIRFRLTNTQHKNIKKVT
jgi:hypothetical protein